MSYCFKFLAFITVITIFGCSSTPTSTSTSTRDENLILGMKKYEENKLAEAKSILLQECEQKAEAACHIVAEILVSEKNFKEAKDYYKKACDYGSLIGCVRIGAIYLDLHQLNETRAALEKSNHLNFNSEFLMIRLLMAEKRAPQAKQLALTLCNNRYPSACFLRALIAFAENDLLTAKKFFALDNELFGSNSIYTGIIELQLGNAKAGEKLISEACASYNNLACRIKKLLDLQKTLTQFEKNYTSKCEHSDKDACYELGLHNFLKRKKDLSSKLFKKACDLGNGNGCLEKYNENKLSMHLPLPINVLIEACDKGSASACFVVYDVNAENKDFDSLTFLERGCSLGNIQACDKLADLEWQKKNIDKAIKRYDESCKLGFQKGCFYSQFLDKNNEIQEVIAQKFCNEKIDGACIELAEIYSKNGRKILAQNYYEKSCNLKNQRSCSWAIDLKSQLDPTYKKFMPHYDLCIKGYGHSCMLAGEYLEEGKQRKGAIDLFERGCFLDNSRSCDYLGWIHKEEKNESKSTQFFKQACDLGSSYSCNLKQI